MSEPDQPRQDAPHPAPSSEAERETSPSGTIGLTELKRQEAEEIARRRAGLGYGDADGPARLTGLSFSGGGIRSACFSLGMMEGLDRHAYAPPSSPLEPMDRADEQRRHLEYFDYVSSVSGGSYAVGHLATSMLPNGSEWFGKVSLTSKTVPGWLWGLGVWFLGVAFQLLKTGSLLIAALALAAFVLRMLDAPDARLFCHALGLESDVARGFAPFWITLGVFLAGYWIDTTSRWRRYLTLTWFLGAVLIVIWYACLVWSYRGNYPSNVGLLGFRPQFQLVLLPVSVVVAGCLVLLAARPLRWALFETPLAAASAAWRWAAGPVGRALARSGLSPRLRAGSARLAGLLSTGRVVRARQGLRWAWDGLRARAGEWPGRRAWRWLWGRPPQMTLRTSLLTPLLVALFCFAGLVATGDVALSSASDDPAYLDRLANRSRWLGEQGDRLYAFAWVALGILSMGFLFPKDLFRSARRVEEASAQRGRRDPGRPRLGWEPVFRVVVFLCSYGFVLLLIFVLFSTVARENVSGYYESRKDLASAAFHPSDIRESERFWERVVADAAAGPDEKRGWAHDWGPLARLLLEARDLAGSPLAAERDRAGKIRLLESLPWITRVAGPVLGVGAPESWGEDVAGLVGGSLASTQRIDNARPAGGASWGKSYEGVRAAFGEVSRRAELAAAALFDLRGWKSYFVDKLGRLEAPPAADLYRLMHKQEEMQGQLASAISEHVLGRPGLWKLFPQDPDYVSPEATEEQAERYKGLAGRYRRQAQALQSLKERFLVQPELETDIRNNNRHALHLYAPGLVRDRRDGVVFASIVWREDQWARIFIFACASCLWVFCCAVDVNAFALQKFYRDHVIDCWVGIPRESRAKTERWLYQAGPTYRGCSIGADGPEASRSRRAPLLLINATLEGNRSLGEEPNLPENIFSFSPLASGSGATGHWLHDGKRERFTRRNHLDIGNIVATSGAFLAPGTIANPALSAVLHLLNVQTGFWARDPKRFRARSPWESFRFHVYQSLGIDTEGDSRFMLTDGAHVENLGLYVLLQRRCALIVASDCGQEDRGTGAERRFDELVQVLQQAGVDGIQVGPFLNSSAYRRWLADRTIPGCGGPHDDCHRSGAVGLDLVLPADGRPGAEPEGCDRGPDAAQAHKGLAQEHFVFAQLLYPEGRKGLLVYVRPTLTGDEGDGLLLAGRSSAFPDDDPVDQFYTPAKMSLYRLLGRHIASELAHDPVMRAALDQAIRGDEVDGRPAEGPRRPEAANGPGHHWHPGPGSPPCDACTAAAPDCHWRRPRPFRSRPASAN